MRAGCLFHDCPELPDGVPMPAVAERTAHSLRIDVDHTLQQLLLLSCRQHALQHVDVLVREHTVQLTGHVSSWYEKQLAQESVRSMVRSHRISNQIQVVRS